MKRAGEADPNDRDSKRRYLYALLRTGRKDLARKVIGKELLCPLSWEVLEETNHPCQRTCSKCDKTVVFNISLPALQSSLAHQQCTAAPRNIYRRYLEEQLTKTPKKLLQTQHPCMFRTPGRPRITKSNLDSVIKQRLIPERMATELGILALARHPKGMLILAALAPPSRQKLSRLRTRLRQQSISAFNLEYVSPKEFDELFQDAYYSVMGYLPPPSDPS